MTERHLHIITHDVPWPADYGGVVDQFYKIKSLHEAGIKIHLHCFLKNRRPQNKLKNYCVEVNYYNRKTNLGGFSFTLPYIINSRKNDELIRRLKQDNYPILLEGIHCSYYVYTGAFSERMVLLRLHNAEFEYYHNLSLYEKNPFKKIYFRHESELLKKYEKQLANKMKIAAVSEQDVQLYREIFDTRDIFFLPAFVPFSLPSGHEGKGCFCLYHGNLSINENEEAAIWLLQNVFNDLEIPFVIAGKDPSQKLEFMVHQQSSTCLVANPNDKELQDMIAKAQIHVLPSFNNTGVKLKLLNALYNGRHCLVNKAGVTGSGLDGICRLAENAADFKTAIMQLFQIPFTEEENDERHALLGKLYNNQKNAGLLIEVFWPKKEVKN